MVDKDKNYKKGQLGSAQALVRPPKDKSKVKSKNIKVSEDVHTRLSKMGSVSEEYGDIVERLLDFWEKNH